MGSQSLCAEAIGTDSIMCRLCNFTGWTLRREKRPWRDKWFIRHMNCREGGRAREMEKKRKSARKEVSIVHFILRYIFIPLKELK